MSEESKKEAFKERMEIGDDNRQREGEDQDLNYDTQRSDQEDVFIAQLHRRARLLNDGFKKQVLVVRRLFADFC